MTQYKIEANAKAKYCELLTYFKCFKSKCKLLKFIFFQIKSFFSPKQSKTTMTKSSILK